MTASAESPGEAGGGEAEAAGAGLGIDRLNPPDVTTFLAGLGRRVGRILSRPVPADIAEPVHDALNELTDRLDALIERFQAVGYPADTGKHPDPDELTRSVPPRHRDAADRAAHGAVEAARRSAGIPLAGWEQDANLLPDARAAVNDLATTLRRLDRLVPEDDDEDGDGGGGNGSAGTGGAEQD